MGCAGLATGNRPDRAGETAAQGDKSVQPGPWPLNVPAATLLWPMAGLGSAIPDVASEGANVWVFHLLANGAVPSSVGSPSNGPDCACAKTHMAMSIADVKIPILHVAIQMDAPAPNAKRAKSS